MILTPYEQAEVVNIIKTGGDINMPKSDIIAACIDTSIDASSGLVVVLSNGSSLYVQSPVPDILISGGTVSITIPAFTSIIEVEGVVESQTGGTIYGIGNNTSDGKGIAWSITGTTLTLDAELVDTKASGYIAVTFLR